MTQRNGVVAGFVDDRFEYLYRNHLVKGQMVLECALESAGCGGRAVYVEVKNDVWER